MAGIFPVVTAVFLLHCIPVSQQYLFLSRHGDANCPACKSTYVRPPRPFFDRVYIIHRVIPYQINMKLT